MSDFEPDEQTFALLGREYQHGGWTIGPRLLSIANRIRNKGGSDQDYEKWVKASHLWTTYVGSTSDSASDQRRHLHGAWDKSEMSRPFDPETSLAELADRIASAYWGGRSGPRNRAVALAFLQFCSDHNCFTRTISCYELSKHTSGLSPATVNNGLRDLCNLGLLRKLEREDKRTSSRSTCRYEINLNWKPQARPGSRAGRETRKGLPKGKRVSETKSPGKNTLSTIRTSAALWSQPSWGKNRPRSGGLGLNAGRVYEVLEDEPATVAEISERAGMSNDAARRAVATLADHCLAGVMPGRPVRYFKVETPLWAVEDMLGCTGYIEHVIGRTEARQAANRIGYPSNYRAVG